MTALHLARAPYDAIVIGGGPAGATTAALLARAGRSVAIVERTAFPRRKVCGEFISATTMPLLRVLGLERTFHERAGPPVCRVGLFARGSMLQAPMPPPDGGETGWGRALGREHLDLMLLDAAQRAGTDLWQPWKCTSVEYRGEQFACALTRNDERAEILGRILVAANGSWERSPLPASTAAPHAPHAPSDLIGFKAHFRGVALPPDLMPLIAFPGGYGGMVHSDDGRTSLSLCIRRDALAACRARHPHNGAGEAVLRHIANSCLGVREALCDAVRDGPWLSAGPIRPGPRSRHAAGVLFVGNAAGEAHPVVAEGISMAMQSAWLLCEALAAHDRIDEAATHYDAAWRSAFAMRVRTAATLAQAAMRPLAVGAMLPLLRIAPGLIGLGARLSGKTSLVVAA